MLIMCLPLSIRGSLGQVVPLRRASFTLIRQYNLRVSNGRATLTVDITPKTQSPIAVCGQGLGLQRPEHGDHPGRDDGYVPRLHRVLLNTY